VQSAQLTLSGSKAVVSNNRLFSTVAHQLDGKRTYALEGATSLRVPRCNGCAMD
jgi:glycerol kinase